MKNALALFAAAFVAALVLLAGCASAPQSPAQAVYQVQGQYAAALAAAVAYRELPTCVPGGPPLCSSPPIVAKLQAADNVAYAALSAAQGIVRAPGAGASIPGAIAAAREAIGALSAIVATLKGPS